MKYLLNLLLALAALAQVSFVFLVLMPEPWPGFSYYEMESIIGEVALAAGLPLLVAAVGVVFTEVRGGPRRILMLAATAVLAVMIGACMSIALEASEAVVGPQGHGFFDVVLIPIPWLGGTIVPLILTAWLCWLINAPQPLRHAAWLRRVTFVALTLTLPGGVLGAVKASMYLSERANYRVEEQQNEARDAAHFASLTDASPLHSWAAYATSRQTSDQSERRPAAVRRLASRPTIEADIAKDLVGSDRDYSDNAFLLVERVQFAPSAALEVPLRRAIARIVTEIREEGVRPGEAAQWKVATLESGISSNFSERLTASLVITVRMAEAGVDLRDALRDLQSAAVEAYPRTRTAEIYQRNVAAADQKIAAILRAQGKAN
jgi:hypothetical protein